jgi:hypothetical protein
MRRALLVLTLVVLACCASPARAPSQPEAEHRRLFDFHSQRWVNLHHVLFHEGMLRNGDDTREQPKLRVDDEHFSDDERAAWRASVAFYAETVSKRSVVMDDGLIAVNAALSALGDADDLGAATAIPQPHREALARAMPVYLAHLWRDDDAANRAWIASVERELARHGAPLAAELSGLFHDEWPKDALRVDVTSWAPPPGAAYTTFDPPHLTIDARDARNGSPYALEIVMHECSHLVIRNVRDALARELAAQGKEERDLWHALLFYTSGWVVARRIPGHEPYADRQHVYDFGDWRKYRDALEVHWRPYLEGKSSYESALRAVVSAM